jgi:hypothetical protein
METFDSDIGHFNPNNPYAGDEKNPIQFYINADQDFSETEKQGRPIYRDTEYIRIYNSKDNIIERPVRDSDKVRWPRQYAAWKNTGASEPGQAGTPLAHWPILSRAQVEEFKYFKIFTVDQLAELPDSIPANIPDRQRLKALAKAHVEAARGEAPLMKMQLELDAKQGQIDEMKAEIRRLTDLVRKKVGK